MKRLSVLSVRLGQCWCVFVEAGIKVGVVEGGIYVGVGGQKEILELNYKYECQKQNVNI